VTIEFGLAQRPISLAEGVTPCAILLTLAISLIYTNHVGYTDSNYNKAVRVRLKAQLLSHSSLGPSRILGQV